MAEPKLDGRRNLVQALSTLSELKDNIPDRITGLLGRYNESGQKEVQAYKADGSAIPNYVWVRINGRSSEVVQAYNETALDTWNLPIILERDSFKRSYRIISKYVAITNDWQGISNIGKHGSQHSFSNTSTQGRDIVWIYRRQMVQPLLCRPKGPPDWTVYVEPDIYLDSNGNFTQWNGGSIDLSSYQPTGPYAKFVTVYLNSSTNTLGVVDGTTFNYISPPVDKIPYIPEPTSPYCIPLAAVYIDSSTGSISWDNVYDLRVFLLGANKGNVSTDGSGTATTVAYWTNASTITGNTNFYWDTTNSSLLIGRSTNDYYNNPAMKLLLQRDTGSTGGGLMSASLFYGNSGYPSHVFGRSRGTAASKSAELVNDVIGEIKFTGYDGSGWTSGAAIRGVAAENYSSGVSGTVLEVWTTPATTGTSVRAFGVDSLLNPDEVVVVNANGNLTTATYADVAALGGGGGGGGGARRLARISAAAGDTIFYLPDLGQTVFSVNINGFQIDPLIYTFDILTNQITLDLALSADAVLVIDYEAQLR